MKLIREMSLVKDRVKALLVKHPHLRDSDNKLIANIWMSDLVKQNLNPNIITAYDFLFYYSNNQFTNTETIRRVRQKIQEENPDLRGTVNEARQEQGKQVRREI
jgi:hypothetical protein